MKRERIYQIQSFQEEWTCPITSIAMMQPVMTVDGHSYEKKDIMEWLKKQATSPKTGLKLDSVQVIPNLVLKNVIYRFQKELKYEYNKICNQKIELSRKLEQCKMQAKDLIKSKEKTQADHQQMKQKYKEMVINSKKLADGFLKLKQDYKVLKEKSNSKQLEMLKTENSKLKNQVQKKQKENQKFTVQNSQLIMARNKATKEAISLKNEVEKLKKEMGSSLAQVDRLKSKEQETLQKLKATSAQKVKVNKELQSIVSRQESQLLKLKQQYDKVIGEKNYQLTVCKKQLNEAISNKDDEILNLKIRIDKLNFQHNQQKIQLKDSLNPFGQLKRDHIQLKNAHSFCLMNSPQKKFNPQTQISRDQRVMAICQSLQAYQPQPQKIEKKFNFFSQKFQVVSKDRKNLKPNKNITGNLSNIMKTVNAISENSNQVLEKLKISSDSVQNIFGNSLVPLNPIQQNQIKKLQLKQSQLCRNIQSQILERSHLSRNLFIQPSSPYIQKIQEEQQQFTNILPFTDYLISNPVLYDEQKALLNHSLSQINMKDFLKYNWSQLKTLNLSDTQLNSNDFELLTNRAAQFPNLQNLFLWNNYIQKIPQSCLDNFKNLKNILFSIQNSFPNPLDQQSITYLKNFEKKKTFDSSQILKQFLITLSCKILRNQQYESKGEIEIGDLIL